MRTVFSEFFPGKTHSPDPPPPAREAPDSPPARIQPIIAGNAPLIRAEAT